MQVKLKVMVGKSSGKEISIPVRQFMIGRADNCHLRPKSDAISRNHCAILVNQDDETVHLRDLNSRNGTFLNGDKILEDMALNPGDKIQAGRLEFEVVIKERTKKPQKRKEPAGVTQESDSVDFDITDWLDEADASEKAQRQSDPETRHFTLDETDRIALSGEGDPPGDESADEDVGKAIPPQKKAPGKLPTRPSVNSNNSREAAADMLKKFFNNR